MPLHENRYLDDRPDSAGEIPQGVPEAILRRAALLPEEDRNLVFMSFKASATRFMIGRALGLNPGTVTRRLQRIGARLHDPIVIALLDRTCPLVPEFRQVGIEHFLQGRSTHEIGERHRISHDRVRRMLHAIRLWHEGGVTPTAPWKNELKSARRRRDRRRKSAPTPRSSTSLAPRSSGNSRRAADPVLLDLSPL